MFTERLVALFTSKFPSPCGVKVVANPSGIEATPKESSCFRPLAG